MKLFLSSTNISAVLFPRFLALVGKNVEDISFALIENAADPYSESEKGFMYDTRKVFESSGMKVARVNLHTYENDQEGLYRILKNFDVVWMGGGNTYYLRWLMKVTGFDAVILRLMSEEIIYGGGSAGAIVAGPALDMFDGVDDANIPPEIIKQGLGLTDVVIIPHWGNPEFQKKLQRIKDHYDALGKFPVAAITDSQAVIVDGDQWGVYPK